jgi:hypothetical protein
MDKKLIDEIFASINKTNALLNQFSPEEVNNMTTTPPRDLITRIMLDKYLSDTSGDK